MFFKKTSGELNPNQLRATVAQSLCLIRGSLVRFPWSACQSVLSWARYWIPNCSWRVGRHFAWQPPPSMYECMYELLWDVRTICCWSTSIFKEMLRYFQAALVATKLSRLTICNLKLGIFKCSVSRARVSWLCLTAFFFLAVGLLF